MMERIRDRLERLQRQIADLEEQASQGRLRSKRRQRLGATIKRLEEEMRMLEEVLGEPPVGR